MVIEKKMPNFLKTASWILAGLTGLLLLSGCDRDRPGSGPGSSTLDRATGKAVVLAAQDSGREPPVSAAAAYDTHCGACHGAYAPLLLPTGSWDKILKGLDDHFGEKVSLEPAVKAAITQYLMENGADRSTAKKAAKIAASLNGQTPLRVTEVPYIQKKHRKMAPEVFQRKAVGGLANCRACHRSAGQGHFSDHDVVIPQ